MIALCRPNGFPLLVNPDLIESAEGAPGGETILTLTSGTTLVVRDSLETLRQAVIDFRRRIGSPGA